MRRSTLPLWLALFPSLLCPALFVHAADKKEEKKKPEPPSIALAIPLASSPGLTNKIKIRGQNLTNVAEIRFANSNLHAEAVIKSKGKAEVPKEMDAKKVGDSQVEIELKFPAGTAAGTNVYTLVSTDGESGPGIFVIIPAPELILEKEPNGSFREAQMIEAGKTVQGAISEAKDVDVFRFVARAGETITAEVKGSCYGSSIDSLLTLYDEQGHQIATNDDTKGGSDSQLRTRIAKEGTYLLSLQDAQDKGGPTYVYLLTLQIER
ncbi:MAG TPA: PPC domain-containing protein [Candidatus Saccharimonadales bacterium]|nr:PPC domain-containing protein [Candidatus Saccharimonadales bacterium]